MFLDATISILGGLGLFFIGVKGEAAPAHAGGDHGNHRRAQHTHADRHGAACDIEQQHAADRIAGVERFVAISIVPQQPLAVADSSQRMPLAGWPQGSR